MLRILKRNSLEVAPYIYVNQTGDYRCEQEKKIDDNFNLSRA